MSDSTTTNAVGSDAFFRVVLTQHFTSRSLYALAGEIESGIIRPGMQIAIDLHSALNAIIDIESIEFMRMDNDELVALTLKIEDVEMVSFLDALELSGERIRIMSTDRPLVSNARDRTS